MILIIDKKRFVPSFFLAKNVKMHQAIAKGADLYFDTNLFW